MDYMDTDQVCDVPDTPDRLDKQNGRHLMEKESDYSVASHSGKSDFFDEGATNWLRGKSKLVIDNGHSRRPSFHPVKKHCTSNKSEFERNVIISLGNSSPSKNAHVFRRMAVDNKANDENRNSLGCQPKEGKGKAIWTSTFRGNDVVDLTEQSGPTQLLQKEFPNGASEHCRTEEIRKVPISGNGFSSLQGIANSSTVAQSAYKGKVKMDDTCKGSPGIDRGKGIFGDSVPNAGKSLLSIPSPSVRGPKRLVRYGFISPHSTQKAKQLAENHMNGSTDVQSDNGAPEYDVSSSLIRELIAEDGNSERRKLFSSKEPGTETMNFSTRRSLTSSEEVSGTSNSNALRSTRNRTKQVNPPLSDRGQHPSKTKNEAHSANQQIESSAAGRDNGSRSSKERGNIHHVDNGNGHFAAASTFIKRQMQSSASSNRGETSTSVDSKIVFLGSSVEPSNSRSINNWSSPGILNPIIEIEELSPERKRGSRRGHTSSNSDSNARGRQLEADEMLARELQEQLYNEAPGGGNGEACNIDAHIALALQQEETSQRAFSGGSHPSHSRGLGISNSSRQPRSRSSQFPSVRRGTQVQGRSSTRMTRLRSRLPSQSTRVSHRERRSIPSPDMDLGMRAHLLEALEAFSGMGVAGNFLQDVHDFNENDYERLLALDENNHHHGGSSLDQINRLPVSTVQGNNFDETCAICLDTPTTGDTIRHLPCLHKFHKDCIDPWLRRKTSCPVCKCSVT